MRLLLIGGAGGVGSLAIQLLKKLTGIQVIATASRPESRAWVKELGADFVINHHENMAEQIAALNIGAPSFVFSTNHTDRHLPQIVELIAPQGRIALIDDPETLDVNPLKGKSLSLHWEFMFTRPLRETADIERQGEILAETARLVDEGIIRPTATQSCTASMPLTCATPMRCWSVGICRQTGGGRLGQLNPPIIFAPLCPLLPVWHPK